MSTVNAKVSKSNSNTTRAFSSIDIEETFGCVNFQQCTDVVFVTSRRCFRDVARCYSNAASKRSYLFFKKIQRKKRVRMEINFKFSCFVAQ